MDEEREDWPVPHSRDWPPPGTGDRPGIWIDNLLPGWITYTHPDMPGYLRVRVKVSRTTDMGMAPEAVLVERTDRHAVTARDLRAVKLPAPWMLPGADEDNINTHPWEPYPQNPLSVGRQGRRGKDEDHWQAVLALWARAQRDAPRSPVRWMREKWPADVSDATMRRWIKKAQQRAAGDREDDPGTTEQGDDHYE